jgi:hypothetical protein
MAHRIAYELAYGPIADGLQVLHRCDNPPCCNPAHLFLGTIKENIHDAMAKGRFTCGVRQHNSKLTDTQVQRLRQQRALGASVQQLATQYQLSPQNVRMIVRRRTWKHVP